MPEKDGRQLAISIANEESNYSKYRGKCKEMSEALVRENSALILVRGFYHCPVWGTQPHWWTKDAEGKIYDPTKLQFPSAGIGVYEEFDGTMPCEECGNMTTEADAAFNGHYAYCSGRCAYNAVMG